MFKTIINMYRSHIDSLKSKGIQIDYDRKILEFGETAPLNLTPTE